MSQALCWFVLSFSLFGKCWSSFGVSLSLLWQNWLLLRQIFSILFQNVIFSSQTGYRPVHMFPHSRDRWSALRNHSNKTEIFYGNCEALATKRTINVACGAKNINSAAFTRELSTALISSQIVDRNAENIWNNQKG